MSQKNGPPAYPFKVHKPVTMTMLVKLGIKSINLAAVFALLKATSKSMPPGYKYKKKSKKIQLPPELNFPGKIISMRYLNEVKGINRSTDLTPFPHSIILDVGTGQGRFVSIKLSTTIQITGPNSEDMAMMVVNSVVGKIIWCQESLELARANLELSIKIRDKMIANRNGFENGNGFENVNEEIDLSDLSETEEEIGKRLYHFFRSRTKYKSLDHLINFFQFVFSEGSLYQGEMTIGKPEYEMVNLHFHLGYPINQTKMTEVMNIYPFEASFKSIKNSSPVVVLYRYLKEDRNTNKKSLKKHTFRINQSGHVKYSGPSLDLMEPVYNLFMHRTLMHYRSIQSEDQKKIQLTVKGKGKVISLSEWKKYLTDEKEVTRKFLENEYLMAQGETLKIEEEIKPKEEIRLNPTLVIEEEEDIKNKLVFNYKPIFSTN